MEYCKVVISKSLLAHSFHSGPSQAAAAGEECPVPDLLQLCGGREEDNNSDSQLFQQTCDDNTDTSIGSTS